MIGTPGDLLPPVVIPGVPDPGITIRIGNPPQRILVVTTNEFDEEVLRVTYDDNGTNNQWGFHEGGGSIHVTGMYRPIDLYLLYRADKDLQSEKFS